MHPASYVLQTRHLRAMKILAITAIVGAALAAAATAAAPTLTLAASAPTVVYGKSVTLTGVLSSQKTNQQITLQEQPCGKTTFTRAGNVKTKKRWVQVKRIILTTFTAGPSKPTMVDSVNFKAKVARRTRVRMSIGKLQAAPCYVAAVSKSFRA